MPNTPKVYVLCDQNCKYEGMTKEQIYTAIMQAIETGEIADINTGFIETIKTINGTGLKVFVGTQVEYNELTAEQKQGLFAIITDDTTKENFYAQLEYLLDKTGALERRMDGGYVANANHATLADNATKAGRATNAENAEKVLHNGSFKDISTILADTENFDAAGSYPYLKAGKAVGDEMGDNIRATYWRYYETAGGVSGNATLPSYGFYHISVKVGTTKYDVGIMLYAAISVAERVFFTRTALGTYNTYFVRIATDGAVNVLRATDNGGEEEMGFTVSCIKVGNII